MHSVDLQAELTGAGERVRQIHLDRIASLGISGTVIAELGCRQVPFGVSNVQVSDDGTYQPGDGSLCIIQGVYDEDGLADLVAWRAVEPHRWWTRLGIGWLLGGEERFPPRWDLNLMLHSSPLEWWRCGGQGCVVLDWDAPDLDSLRLFETITCAEASLATALRGALCRSFRMPRITTAEDRYAA